MELKPPPEYGFSGTALFDAVVNAALIQALIERGYTVVMRKDSAA